MNNNIFFEAVNKPIYAFKRNSGKISCLFVLITVLLVTVFDPLLRYLVNSDHYEVTIDIFRILWLSTAGIATYITICTFMWAICKSLGSTVKISSYLKNWGVTYIPNIVCAVAVVLAETYFYIFWNNSIWGMLLNIVFVGILIWKTTLYILFLKEVAGLNGKKLLGAFIMCGFIIIVLAFINMFIGLKTPIL